MGLINNFFNKKISNYINKELDVQIDPSAVIIKDETFRELENRVWYEANTATELEGFYKTNFPAGLLYTGREFYRRVQGKTPRVHVPMAKTITDTVVNLVFSETPEMTVDTGNQKTSKVLNEEIEDTLIENNKEDLIKQVGAMVSYSGCAAVKFIIDSDISDRVILQPYAKEDIDVKRKYGRVIEIVFKDYFDDGYTLKSAYGLGYIKFSLTKNGKEAKLTDLEETSDLKDLEFITSTGEPYKQLMAMYVENNPNAASDYEGIIDLMMYLDEIKSAENHILRALKPKRGVPSALCEIDRETGKTVLPDDWDREEVLLEVEDPESKIKNMSEVNFVSPDLTSYQEEFKETVKAILNKVSLSESTLGNNDGGSDASSLALNIREKSSLRKRAALITRYDRAFKELIKLILVYNHAIFGDGGAIVEDTDYEYFVDFSEYSSPSFDQMVEILGKALSSGLISQKEAIRELYEGDMSEEEQDEMIAEINADKQKAFEQKKELKDDESSKENLEKDDEKDEKK